MSSLPSGENTIWSCISLCLPEWMAGCLTCLETDKGKENFQKSTFMTLSWSPGTLGCRVYVGHVVQLKELFHWWGFPKCIAMWCFSFNVCQFVFGKDILCLFVWVIMTTNSHFDSQYMEIKSPPGAEDACFWYPADLVYKQGLCVCVCMCAFFPKQQNKTINYNLTECIREEHEFGMQQESWGSAQQRWKWDTDGHSLIGFS